MESEFFEEWFRKRILEKIIKEIGHRLLFRLLFLPGLNSKEKYGLSLRRKLKDIDHNFNMLEKTVHIME